MEDIQFAAIVHALYVGAGSAAAYQLLKGNEWNSWLQRFLSASLAGGSGYLFTSGDTAAALASVGFGSATFAWAFHGTKLGEALRLNLAPRGLKFAGELTTSFAKIVSELTSKLAVALNGTDKPEAPTPKT